MNFYNNFRLKRRMTLEMFLIIVAAIMKGYTATFCRLYERIEEVISTPGSFQ